MSIDHRFIVTAARNISHHARALAEELRAQGDLAGAERLERMAADAEARAGQFDRPARREGGRFFGGMSRRLPL